MKKLLIAEGFSRDTIKAAKELLGVESDQDKGTKHWYWRLPLDSDIDVSN